MASLQTLPAGQTSVDCFITLPADLLFVSQIITVVPGGVFPSVKFALLNRTAVPLTVTAPASVAAGVTVQVDISCPPFFPIGFEGCGPVNLRLRTVTVSAVDFDAPSISVPVTLNSVTNDAANNATKHLSLTFPPLTERRAKLIVTTDDGIIGRSGLVEVSAAPNADGDGINDLVETALQRTPGQRHEPPLIIERDATGMHAVPGNRPLDLQGWSIVIEQSSDLQTWTAAPAADTTITPNPDGTTERVSVLLPSGEGPHFVRLKAMKP